MSEIKEKVETYLNSHPATNNPIKDKEDFAYHMASEFKLKDSQITELYNALPDTLLTDMCIKSLMFLLPDYSKTWQFREKAFGLSTFV